MYYKYIINNTRVTNGEVINVSLYVIPLFIKVIFHTVSREPECESASPDRSAPDERVSNIVRDRSSRYLILFLYFRYRAEPCFFVLMVPLLMIPVVRRVTT
jgi:hypothetical protein